MATNITVTVVDEGYFKKSFSFSTTLRLKKLLDAYRTHICGKCSNSGLLDFWFEATKITDDHTADALAMQTGDIIDVRIAEICTRGACPVPPEQTHPNIHYLSESPQYERDSVQMHEEQPKAPSRINMTLRDQNGFEMKLRLKVNTTFEKIMEAFASQVKRDRHECRFLIDGMALLDDQTPKMVEMEDDDTIDVYYEVRGGCSLECTGEI